MSKNKSIVILVIGIAALLPFFTSHGAEIPSEKIFLYAKPTVVRIGVSVSGTVRYPELKLAEDESGNVVAVTTGEISESEEVTGWTCSGFVVHPSGYIVTNAHCVDGSGDNVSNYVWEQFTDELLAELQSKLTTRLDQTQIDNLHTQILNFIAKEGIIDNQTFWPIVFDPSRSEGSIQEFIDKGFQVETKKMGQSYPQYGKDVAIIKIEKDNLVTVKLGDSREVKPGSRVFVMGFPGVADLNEKGYLEPSFTSGVVSAVKKSSQGDYNVVQIDAAISGGNSGGPVFNENGEVIGIATFGALESQGFNWILPIELAQEFLRETNIQNTSGVTDERYRKGVDLFLDQRYSKAKKEFEATQALYHSQAVAQLITKSNEAIAKGEEKRIPLAVLIGLGVAAILLIVGVIYILVQRSHRKLAAEITSRQSALQPSAPVKPIDPRLSSYIAQSRSQGMSDADIRQALRQEAGWPEDDINAALRV